MDPIYPTTYEGERTKRYNSFKTAWGGRIEIWMVWHGDRHFHRVTFAPKNDAARVYYEGARCGARSVADQARGWQHYSDGTVAGVGTRWSNSKRSLGPKAYRKFREGRDPTRVCAARPKRGSTQWIRWPWRPSLISACSNR